jgi:CheY-like chemotaxis protein
LDGEHYRGFIEEAFIRPMRSVLIVDDDYPTLEDILLGKGPEDNKRWRKNSKGVSNVIDGFHKADPPLVVDVHDASNVEPSEDAAAAAHLHQCDLLVLDFELDKTREHNGDQSMAILRRILSNPQFNLVILHTRTKLATVFPQVLRSLLRPAASFISPDDESWAKDLVFEYELDTPGFSAGILAALGAEQYLYFRNGGCVWPVEAGPVAPDFSAVDTAARALNCNGDVKKAKLALFLMKQLEEDFFRGPLSPDFGPLEWSNGEPRWIRSDSGFIAFTKKNPDGKLLDALMDALISWGPPPSRLFLARLRAELDKAGVAAEGKALGNKKVLAHWYKGLVKGNDLKRDGMIAATVSRHTEMLMDDILPRVREFAGRMVASENRDDDLDALCLKYFRYDLGPAANGKSALNEHNAFVCSKPVEGHHLATGHIFKVDDDYWVCLTPLCDLMPDQGRILIGEYQPVLAAKLKKTKGTGVPDNINEGATVVLKLENDTPVGYTIAAQSNSQPEWRTFYARDRGRFVNKELELFFMAPDPETGLPGILSKRAPLVGQLRYEYALSLMHRLGSSMTRVGLDFEKTA